MRANIYIDIDGVLLANESNLANHAEAFLKAAHKRGNVYWLTTHCMNGDSSWAVKYVGRHCTLETVELLRKIKPTSWKQAKTEAIDFSKPFVWFDDDLYEDERAILMDNNSLDNWVQVDLAKDENQLFKFIDSFPLPAK